MYETSGKTSVNGGGRPNNSLGAKFCSTLTADLAEARREAIERLRTLHPKLKLKAITERLGRAPMDGFPSWLTVDFWSEQIDLVLLAGIQGGRAGRDQAIERIRSVWPAIDAEALGQRMEKLASNGLPAYMQEKFWTPEMDRILIAGLQDGTQGQQAALVSTFLVSDFGRQTPPGRRSEPPTQLPTHSRIFAA